MNNLCLCLPFKKSIRVGWVSFLVLVVSVSCGDAAEESVRYQRLFSFGSLTNNGWQPWCALIEGRDGALYGTTYNGGTGNYGVVFKLNKDGKDYRLLHHFGVVAGDGRKSIAGLLETAGGFLYGTTISGGVQGAGTVFRIRPDGTDYAVLRSFVTSDGIEPQAGLIEGSDGILYGTSANGGGASFSGTVFAVNQDGGGFRVLHRFGPGTSLDGTQPSASLLEGSDGFLYGTTVTGGGNGVGSVFRLKKDGSGYQKLYAFGFNENVVNPYAALMEGSDHALYGTAAGGYGGIFKLNRDGTSYRVLASVGGATPFGALVKGRDGALYTTLTKGGGRFGLAGNGSVYRIREDGSGPETLYSFGNTAGDGVWPHATLLLASDGAYYSTTFKGGDLDRGTVFRLLVNRPPVAQITNLIVSADANCTALASVDNGSFDPDGDSITMFQTPPGPYRLGTNSVKLTVVDHHGDSNSASSLVIVVDSTPPEIQCPPNVLVEFTSEAGAVVEYQVIATDACDTRVSVHCTPASGSVFPIGETGVVCTASDVSGNPTTCNFRINVLGARGVKQSVLSELIALRGTLGCTNSPLRSRELCAKLDSSIQRLCVALNPSAWIDQTRLDRKLGGRVFTEENLAVNELCELLKEKYDDVPKILLQQFVERILRADRLLAAVAIADGLGAGSRPQRIAQAQRFLIKGDTAAAENPCGNGIESFRLAWLHALHPRLLSPTLLPSGGTRLEILCDPGEHMAIQASSDLVNWITLGDGHANNEGVIVFEDSEASGHTVRYYRSMAE